LLALTIKTRNLYDVTAVFIQWCRATATVACYHVERDGEVGRNSTWKLLHCGGQGKWSIGGRFKISLPLQEWEQPDYSEHVFLATSQHRPASGVVQIRFLREEKKGGPLLQFSE
jgi:hypothetical protein